MDSNKIKSQIRSERYPMSKPLEGLPALWEQTLGDPEITIAVLDGPCDISHPSFAGASIKQMDFVGSDAAEGMAGEHGTHAASIIFGQHGSPVKGIAPRCQGIIIPIFRHAPQGGILNCSQPDLARAIQAASNSGANVINISAGQFSLSGSAHPMLAEAIHECQKQGRLIVAAAGNDGCRCLHVPGALPSVLAVGAMDADGNPMEFSNWGSNYQISGVLAPGVNIHGALPGKGVGIRTGTSFATPIVSGLAGLLFSLQKQQGQELNASAIRAAILESAIGCEQRAIPDCRRLLAGRLNISGAVSKIIDGSHKKGGNIMSNSINGETTPNSSNSSVQPVVGHHDGSVTQSPKSKVAKGEAQVSEPQAVTLSCSPAPTSQDHSAKATIERDVQKQAEINEMPGMVSESTNSNVTDVAPAGITASHCACKKNGKLVYAIGGLTVDFGTLARMDSIQQNAETFNAGPRLNTKVTGHLLRHLLGWKESYTPPGGKSKKTVFHKPHFYDAKDIIWVLTQDESPLYAIKPSGPYAEEGYLELAHFLMELEGYGEEHEPLQEGTGPGNQFYHPSLETDEGAEPNRKTNKKTGRTVPIIDRIAIPGTLNGTVRLLNGMVIPVICPNMRGTRSWRLGELVCMHCEFDPDSKSKEAQEQEKMMLYMERISQRFFEEARNQGLEGGDRAVNFAATQSFEIAPHLRRKFKIDFDPDLESVSVQRSPTCREDSECYDVDVEFFDADNIMRSKTVVRYTIDVSDEVPVRLGEPRQFRRR